MQVIAPGWEAAAADHLNSAPVPSYAEFQRTVVTVNSRAYGEDAPCLPEDDENIDDEEATMSLQDMSTTCLLVPAVDLCNHECASKVNAVKGLAPWGHFVVVADRYAHYVFSFNSYFHYMRELTDSTAVGWVDYFKMVFEPSSFSHVHYDFIRALRPIEIGDEIFLSYGQMPSRFLMAQFGFVLQPPDDVAELDFDQPTVAFLTNNLDPAMLEKLCGAGLLARGADGRCATHQLGGLQLQEACAKLEVDYGRLLSAQRSVPGSRGRDSVSSISSPRQRLAVEYRKAQKKLLELEERRFRTGNNPTSLEP